MDLIRKLGHPLAWRDARAKARRALNRIKLADPKHVVCVEQTTHYCIFDFDRICHEIQTLNWQVENQITGWDKIGNAVFTISFKRRDELPVVPV